MKSKKYTTPRLCTSKNDITKDWYVYFTYSDNTQSKQFRYKLGINYFHTAKEREAEGKAIISALEYKLKSGWSPFTGETDTIKLNPKVSDALDEILNIKKSYITPRSYKTYNDQLNLFKTWLKLVRLDYLYIQNFAPSHARMYFDWLLTEKNYCGKTHNGHLNCLRTFFNSCVERNYITSSPISGIKAVREDAGKNIVYMPDEEKRLVEYMKKDDFHFYLATRIVRYCFLRRSELAKLQVKHIRWENKTIVIPSENAKNRTQDSVTIPKTLEVLIEQSGLLKLEPNTFIFGNHSPKHFAPGKEKLKRVDDLSDKQRTINRLLKIRSECTFYAWKHTGAVDLFNHTKDVYVVMRQCRHSDIKMTMIYLRSLGCGVNEQVRDW